MSAFVRSIDLDQYLSAALVDSTTSEQPDSKVRHVLERVLDRRLADEEITQYRPQLPRLVAEKVRR